MYDNTFNIFNIFNNVVTPYLEDYSNAIQLHHYNQSIYSLSGRLRWSPGMCGTEGRYLWAAWTHQLGHRLRPHRLPRCLHQRLQICSLRLDSLTHRFIDRPFGQLLAWNSCTTIDRLSAQESTSNMSTHMCTEFKVDDNFSFIEYWNPHNKRLQFHYYFIKR